MVGVVSSCGGVGLLTFGVWRVFACFCVFFGKLNKRRGGVCLNCPSIACYQFCCTRELKFAANVRNDQNVGFHLKRKSKNDSEAMRGDSSDDESKDDEEKQRRGKQE